MTAPSDRTLVEPPPDPLALLGEVPFDECPEEMSLRAFGVEYLHLHPREGGDLYLTRFGWSHLDQLLPSRWYADRAYARQGQRLAGSTGAVYRLPPRAMGEGNSRGRGCPDLVVKFSRVAREVPIVAASSFLENAPPEAIAAARFNSPFEEFGLVMELRRGGLAPRSPRLVTQRPLAIYAPPERLDLWKLGRSECRFQSHHDRLSRDQEHAVKAIELDIGRIYVVLYGWIDGQDAEEIHLDSAITEEELHAFTGRVTGELRDRGFRVLDNKPKHFILRRHPKTGAPLRKRDGTLVYGLVDFELLQRTPEHQHLFEVRRRRRYWIHRTPEPSPRPAGLPSHIEAIQIFGVSYLFTTTPDGGKLWVVGRNPDLVDYFLPDRWRRTPRLDLSPTHEVYRTRTRDGIQLVYRRSRVGAPPRSDPLEANGQEIRAHGFNSPFEEIAIARILRQLGIPTTHPRAIYRTAHLSSEVAYIRDDRRFIDHADLLTPESPPAPILSSEHDYYVLWDRFLGRTSPAAPVPDRASPILHHSEAPEVLIDLETAHSDGLLGREAYEQTLAEARKRLAGVGRVRDHLRDIDLACALGAPATEEERPAADPARFSSPAQTEPIDPMCLRTSLDALAAFDLGAMSEEDYRRVLTRLDARLRAADCEQLDLRGTHVLLSMAPDGTFDRDESGEIHTTLCSFDLIRGLYRPIR